jgi:hypothetical protein
MRHICWCEGFWSDTKPAWSTYLRIRWWPRGLAKRFLIRLARWLADSEGQFLRIILQLENGIYSGFGDFQKSKIQDLFFSVGIDHIPVKNQMATVELWGTVAATFIEGNIQYYYRNLLLKLNSIKPSAALTYANKHFW